MMSMMPPALSSSDSHPEIDVFLDEFAKKITGFEKACQQYQRAEISIADITRFLSEATADAELVFSEKSQVMGMEQLQRYAMLQKQLDNLTVQVFETEIQNNRKVILEALSQGDYFIINITYNAIKSSIHMICAKHKIKTQQDQMLAETQQELEVAQTFIKVLKALESVFKVDPPDPFDWLKIQKSLGIYDEYFRKAEPLSLKQASDQRVFNLFAEHFTLVRQTQPEGWQEHLTQCLKRLDTIAIQPEHTVRLAEWTRQMLHPPAQMQAEPVPESPKPAGGNSSKPLSWQLAHLDGKLRIASTQDLDFETIESSLSEITSTILASGGAEENAASCQKVFTLMEGYIDYLSNIALGKDPPSTAGHITRCCQTIAGLAQEHQHQMLEAWRNIPNSLNVICPAPQDSEAYLPHEADNPEIQMMLNQFQILEALIGARDADEVSFAQIEMALDLYFNTLEQTAQFPMRSTFDQRIFDLFEEHVMFLRQPRETADPELDKSHLSTCLDLLEAMAQDPASQERIRQWRQWTLA